MREIRTSGSTRGEDPAAEDTVPHRWRGGLVRPNFTAWRD